MIYEPNHGDRDPLIFEPVHDCDEVVEGHSGQWHYHDCLAVLPRGRLRAFPAPAPAEVVEAKPARFAVRTTALPVGWVLKINRNADGMWLSVTGPKGEAAAWHAPAGGVRVKVLDRLAAAILA